MSTSRRAHWIAVVVTLLLGATNATPSGAQSTQTRIEGLLQALPTLESNELGGGLSCSTDPLSGLATGLDGVFFNLTTDLTDNLALNSETKSLLGRLSDELALRGTILVAMPMPTRGIVQSRHLNGLDARQRNFDPTYATQDFEQLVSDLRNAGVVTVDVLAAIKEKGAWSNFYYLRDNNWKTAGSRLAAEAVAVELAKHPVYSDLEKGTFETTAMATVQRKDRMAVAIQQLCHRSVPGERDTSYVTKMVADSSTDRGASALAGSTLSGDPAFNFVGFLQEESGLEFINYAEGATDPIASIARLLYSDEFERDPPAFVVWEIPPGFNLNLAAFQSLRQIIPALYEDCRDDAVVSESDPVAISGQRSLLELGDGKGVAGSHYYLHLKSSRPVLSKLGLAVTYPNHDADISVLGGFSTEGSSDFYLELADEFGGFVQQVIVTGDTAGSTLQLTVCRTPDGAGSDE